MEHNEVSRIAKLIKAYNGMMFARGCERGEMHNCFSLDIKSPRQNK
jgi:hypothetical protein